MESIGSVDNDLKATELRLGLPGRDDDTEDEETVVAVQQQDPSSCSKITPPNHNNNKRPLSDHQSSDCESEQKGTSLLSKNAQNVASKSQIVGWPPVRFSRKNSFQMSSKKTEETGAGAGSSGRYVKVSMDGAPFLRKIDLNGYNSYPQLLKAVENMFKLKIGEYMEKEGYKGSEYAPAYEDKDGDLMLVGDVPWDMFISSCKRLRIMKGSDAKGLGFGA